MFVRMVYYRHACILLLTFSINMCRLFTHLIFSPSKQLALGEKNS
jgi:hypothetical protein